MGIFGRVRQALRDRRALLADRTAYIDKLDRSPRQLAGEDGPQPLSSWEAIFARPDWPKEKAGHNGRCSCCGAKVSPSATTCGNCGATWMTHVKRKHKIRRFLFCVVSIAISLIIGRSCAEIFVYSYYRFNTVGINYDFVNFGEWYIWATCTVLVLVLSTYIYEKMDIAPKGIWVCKSGER
jgi:ribosomal protein L40E